MFLKWQQSCASYDINEDFCFFLEIFTHLLSTKTIISPLIFIYIKSSDNWVKGDSSLFHVHGFVNAFSYRFELVSSSRFSHFAPGEGRHTQREAEKPVLYYLAQLQAAHSETSEMFSCSETAVHNSVL